MKVIFIQNVAKHGQIGEIKEVSNGFATNVLIPKSQAIIATKEAIAKIQKAKENKAQQLEQEKNLFLKTINDLQNKLNQNSDGFLILKVKNKDKSGALFSHIKEVDIADTIYDILKISLNQKQIILPREAIKKVGEYKFSLTDNNRQQEFKLKIL